MLLRPLSTYAGARCVTLSLEAIATRVLRARPAFDRVAIIVRGLYGWPSTILVCLVSSLLLPLLGIDTELWGSMARLKHYLPTCYWLVAVGLSRPIVDGMNSATLCKLSCRQAYPSPTYVNSTSEVLHQPSDTGLL